MLESLLIRNIALIDSLTVSFGSGLHVLTGETGAGKSIIVDALLLLLGGRASRELIRTGSDKAYVEGQFSVSSCAPASEFLKVNELEDEDGCIILSREITVAGRSSCRINGILFPLSLYRSLAALLMDIHGQHECQSLMDEKQHLRLLDAFGDAAHRALLTAAAHDYQAMKETANALNKLKNDLRVRQEREDILRYQQQELKNAHLVRGEEDELIRERDLNKNAEKIKSSLRDAYVQVYGDTRSASALDALRAAASALKELSPFDAEFKDLAERTQSLYYDAEDIGLTLRDKLDSLNFDEDRMEEIMTRLDQLRRLSRKYGATADDMLDKLEEINRTLDILSHADERLEELEKALEKQKKQYHVSAKALSESRKALANSFETRMEVQLNDLNMRGTRFVVSLSSGAETASGTDECAFLIAPNRGEKLQPLSLTASGGELSRLMLAIKSIAAAQSLIPSMVFDEIDTGISGRTAQVVAEKMADIARYRQVLCITHLAQIAAMADRQYRVEKAFDGQRTVTHIVELDEQGRIDELSRMVGGADADSESARSHAKALLSQARDYRK